MTDRELLELAAKAAGYPPEWKGAIKIAVDAPAYERKWNPLADDGDALRLAVKLRIKITGHAARGATRALVCANAHDYQALEFYEDEGFSAARRAIVRVAAEIGKAMPE